MKRVPRKGSNPLRPISARMDEKPGGKCVTGWLDASQATIAIPLRYCAPATYAIESSRCSSPVESHKDEKSRQYGKVAQD